MAQTYTVRIQDKLIRLDATNDDWVVTLLPFVQTPNAPYEIHKISIGDGHTVTVQVDPATSDFLLSDGSTSITLDDTNNTVRIKIPADGRSPAFVTSGGGGSGGGGGGGGAGNVPAPPVTIDGPAEIFFRSNGQVEVDVEWSPSSSATAVNFRGAAVYLEDPDISSGGNIPLDGSVALDGTAQASGQWAPVFVNDSLPADSGDGTAVVMLDSTMGSVSGQSYKTARNVRIYLAAYGPYSQPKLVRANEAGATPNIMVEIAQGPDQYQKGMEWAFLCANPQVQVNTNYNRPDPNYYLTFTYDPPDPSTPLPPGVNQFGGCRIVFVYEDSGGAPQFPGTDSGINVPVAQSQTGYMSPAYTAAMGGLQFRAYFCSEDNSHPLGNHINSLVEGVTPFIEVSVPQVAPAPDVTGFSIANESIEWLLNQTFVAHADFSWNLPTAAAGGARYAGVYLYLVNVTGGVPPLTAFPQKLTGLQSNVDISFGLDVPNVPANPEVWTIAAISVDANGGLENPAHFGQAGFHSPTVTWNIGPPVPGTPGGGQEYAPLVTINAGAAATATQSMSSDGVGMVSFQVGTWTDPASNQFGAAQVAMVLNNDPTKPTYWSVPGGAGSFTTPAMPSFGNIGATVPVDFYIVSDDPQGNKNSLHAGTTPVIHATYTPAAGAIIPARSGWFDPTQFNWVSGDVFTGVSFSASIIQVGKTLVVGGGPATFGGSSNGQIAVQDSSGKLLAWMGEQQPTQGAGTQIWGGWFGQLWVGGTSPLNAPLWVDNNGIIEVGGIAAAHGATYPYISVRDATGLEAGRIGAVISAPSGSPGDNVGSAPPTITAGAWFTQLAVGGSHLSNWNVLITPDATNPLGSNFQIRNVNLLSIDYAALSGTPSRNQYKLDFGNSVWMAAGLSGTWQFPGIHIYEIDGQSSPNFGSTFLSRGVVIRGTAKPSGESSPVYPVLVSLTAWNGDQGGSDIPAQFFGILAMSCPLSPYAQNVVIASGESSSGTVSGDAYLHLADHNGTTVLNADAGTGCTARSFATVAYGAVIDTNGNWLGKPITGAQTPWNSDIQASGHSLSNVGSLQVNGTTTTGALSVPGSATVTGNVQAGSANISNALTANTLSASSATISGGLSAGSYSGGGINIGANGISCGFLQTNAGGGSGEIDTVTLRASGAITATGDISGGTLSVAGTLMISNAGIFVSPHGVQTNAAVYGSSFGIYGVSVGWSGTFTSANGKTVTVNGGIITNVA